MTVTDAVRASLRPGTVVGRYTIERLIGAGGMGEVYAARDATLGRRVALKTLKPAHALDLERVRRFVREAEAASSLNHPAIVAVHDSGVATVDGEALHYLTMEYLDGESLSSWLQSPRQIRKKIELLAQVADGLACAHRGGIVHRDLKPDNIIITADGYAKVVDFGVAKLSENGEGGGKSHADTLSSGFVGTVAYMSPEQVEGRPVDQRSDIFSFGCVLHEALSGKAPFRRRTTVDTLHAIVHEPAEVLDVRPELQRILRRCLAKDPEERYHSIKDVALDLRDVAREPEIASSAQPRSSRSLAIAAALLILLGGAALVYFVSRRAKETPAATNGGLQMTRLTASGNVLSAAVSPDGKYLVYATQQDRNQTLWVRQIAAGTDVEIVPTRMIDYQDIEVSADGNYIYYTAVHREDTNVYSVYQLPILGGTPRKIAHDTEEQFALSPDGKTGAFRRINVMRADSRLVVIDIETGREEELLQRKFPRAIGPLCWSPTGRKLIYADVESKPVRSTLWELDVDTKTSRRLFPQEWWRIQSLAAAPDGSGVMASLYEPIQPPQIWFLPFEGTPRKLTSDISEYGVISMTADSQSVVSIRGNAASNLAIIDFDRPDTPRFLTTGPGNHYGGGGVRWSRSGTVVFTAWENGPPRLMIMKTDGTERRALTHRMAAWSPLISPDEKKILFMSSTGGPPELWMADINGTNLRQIKLNEPPGRVDFFPDGNEIAFTTGGAKQGAWRMSLSGGEPQRLTDGPANNVTVSPDGKQVLCRLRQPDGSTPLWRTALIPLGGGEIRYFNVPEFASPRFDWMPDGSGFTYLETTGGASNVWFQPIDGSAPRALTNLTSGYIKDFDISPDGKAVILALSDPSYDAVMIRGFR